MSHGTKRSPAHLNTEKRREEQSTDGKSKCPCLEEVADEQSGRGLVKLVSLLEHERLVYGHGYSWESARHKNSCTECEILCDLRIRVNTASMNKRIGGYLVFGAIAEVTYDLASEIPCTCIQYR